MYEISEDAIEHYGVKGMKWGVHRDRYRTLRDSSTVLPRQEFKTAKGVSVALTETPTDKLTALLGSSSKKMFDQVSNSKTFDIEVEGKVVGDAAFRKRSADELNLTWLGVNPDQRGKGYASTVFDAGVAYAQSQGFKKLSLEVPGNAPDARHIYEKRGFKSTGKVIGDKNDYWGGLTVMELDISKGAKVRHADSDEVTEEEMEFAQYQWALAMGVDPAYLKHGMELVHYGIKGMKWGVHRSRKSSDSGEPAHDDAIRAKEYKARVRRGSTDTLSTQELQALVSRMNLEKQYNQLKPDTGAQKARKAVANVLVTAGKQQASRAVNDQLAKYMAAKLKK
jgi:N-acetylglutamate synthase-like GNAT family acetyltransferase